MNSKIKRCKHKALPVRIGLCTVDRFAETLMGFVLFLGQDLYCNLNLMDFSQLR